MGKRRNQHFKNRAKKSKPDDSIIVDPSYDTNIQSGRQNYVLREVPRYSDLFDDFYKRQGIVKEDEWDNFLNSCRRPLPSCFRITGSNALAQTLLEMLENDYFKHLREIKIDGAIFSPPSAVPWYPGNLVWKINIARNVIRKNDKLQSLHKFLIGETKTGNISRQEEVSMIPPMLLDVEPHHKVLDMCAAPGSKTAQLIEAMHSEGNEIPKGIVVANDKDSKRCYIMVHQTKRLNSPSVLVVNHDSRFFPKLRFGPSGTEKLRYDRILCDVPCSGDGTLRKNPIIWRKWSPALGNGMHGIQVQILQRSLELLEVGGRLCYSTCSLSPVENEAVVAHLVHKYKDSVRILDVGDRLQGLKRMPGMLSWQVSTKRGTNYYKSYEEIALEKHSLLPSMFPVCSEEEMQKLGIGNCLRVLPHFQDSGGFFIAVLAKTKPLSNQEQRDTLRLSAKLTDVNNKSVDDGSVGVKDDIAQGNADKEVHVDEAVPDNNLVDLNDRQVSDDAECKEGIVDVTESKENASHSKLDAKCKGKGYLEDPFLSVAPGDDLWRDACGYFGLSAAFAPDYLLVRSEKMNKIYLVNRLIRQLLNHNPGLKVVNTGVSILARTSSKAQEDCNFRLTQEGLPYLLSGLEASPRRFSVPKEDLVQMLQMQYPLFEDLTEALRVEIEKLPSGSVLMLCGAVAVCGWKGQRSLRVYTNSGERLSMLRLLGVAITEEELTAKMRSESEGRLTPNNAEGVCEDEVGE